MSLEYELKYVASAHRTPALRSYLRQVLRSDPKYPRAWVETVYFDGVHFESLGEKINSDYLKTKFRLRWYVDSETGAASEAFAEIKHRVGGRRRKSRVPTGRPGRELGALPLEDLRWRRLAADQAARGLELPHNLFPMLHLRYERERFVDPVSGVRISLDSMISVRRVHRGFLRHTPVLPLTEALVEVKGPSRTLPVSLNLLPDLGCRRSSFSKYGACVERAMAPAA